jgi:very-short-patch-repair endonuclease
MGLSPKIIERRVASARLHVLWRGVYAAGRPTLTAHGWWMAAVLACGAGAVLSHDSAGRLWRMRGTNTGNEGRRVRPPVIHVSVPSDRSRRLDGIRAHRRRQLAEIEVTQCERIPATTPARTLIDLATLLQPSELEAAVNAADKLGLVDPEQLRRNVDHRSGTDGVKALRRLLDRQTFSLTDSELERRFLKLIRRAGLPLPETQQRIEDFRVDFFWPGLGLVVETDGLRYHRTPTQQSKDRTRDQVLVAGGFTVVRFTHAQVTYDPDQVVKTLRAVSKPISKD